jgi:hypothetical protein
VSSDGTVILRREKQKIAGFECGYVIIDEDDIYSGFFGKQKKKDQWAKYKTAANIP